MTELEQAFRARFACLETVFFDDAISQYVLRIVATSLSGIRFGLEFPIGKEATEEAHRRGFSGELVQFISRLPKPEVYAIIGDVNKASRPDLECAIDFLPDGTIARVYSAFGCVFVESSDRFAIVRTGAFIEREESHFAGEIAATACGHHLLSFDFRPAGEAKK